MLTDRKPAAGSAVAASDAKILPFKRRAREHRRHLPPIKDPLRSFDDEEDRRRMQQNLVAILLLVALASSGFWLIDHLLTSAHIAACVEAGHSNCVPLDLHPGRRWW